MVYEAGATRRRMGCQPEPAQAACQWCGTLPPFSPRKKTSLRRRTNTTLQTLALHCEPCRPLSAVRSGHTSPPGRRLRVRVDAAAAGRSPHRRPAPPCSVLRVHADATAASPGTHPRVAAAAMVCVSPLPPSSSPHVPVALGGPRAPATWRCATCAQAVATMCSPSGLWCSSTVYPLAHAHTQNPSNCHAATVGGN